MTVTSYGQKKYPKVAPRLKWISLRLTRLSTRIVWARCWKWWVGVGVWMWVGWCVWVCVSVCVYVWLCVCVYVFEWVCLCVSVGVCEGVSEWVCVCMFVCMCVLYCIFILNMTTRCTKLIKNLYQIITYSLTYPQNSVRKLFLVFECWIFIITVNSLLLLYFVLGARDCSGPYGSRG